MSLESEALLNILRTAGYVDAGVAEVLRPADLSPSQYNVLRILRGAGKAGLACGEIAGRMVARDPDVTRLLDRLAGRGFIARSRESKDRRVVTVRITAGGLRVLQGLDGAIERFTHDCLGKLGAQSLRALIESLEMARSLDGANALR
jgi:DNA-binding MarR family transcriptional regulator